MDGHNAAVATSPSASESGHQRGRRDSVADVLCAACATVEDRNAIDLGKLAENNPAVMEFAKQVCAKILEARAHMRNTKVSTDPEVLEAYVPLLKVSATKQAVMGPANKMLTSAVTTFSAFMCLKHVLKHNAQSSPILRSLAASQHMKQQRATVLPVGKGDQLSKDLFMILHSRNCQEDACSLQFCAGMRDFLKSADKVPFDEAKDDVLYLKQLEKHESRCKNPNCNVCKEARERVDNHQKLATAEILEQLRASTESLESHGSSPAQGRSRARSSRSVSMPPRPDAATVQMMQQQNPQFPNMAAMMVANSYGMWPMMPQFAQMMMPQTASQAYPFMGYPMSAPMMQPPFATMTQPSSPAAMQMQQQQQQQVAPAMPPSVSARLRQGRSKAYSNPVPPNLSRMDEDDDEEENEEAEE